MFTATAYVRAESLEQAYQLNQKKNNRIAAGMLWLKMSSRNYQTVIDLSGLGLDRIEETEDSVRIGCMVTLRSFENSEILKKYFGDGPKEAVRHIVGTQFRNCGTVGGSIWGRFGFSDVLSYLLALDTTVELYHAGSIPLREFAQMPYDRDILTAIVIRKDSPRAVYMTYRNETTDFPVLTCAVSEKNGAYRAVIGARPLPARSVELTAVSGTGLSEEQIEAGAAEAADAFSYGKNMRGSAEYRHYLAKVLARRCLTALQEEQL